MLLLLLRKFYLTFLILYLKVNKKALPLGQGLKNKRPCYLALAAAFLAGAFLPLFTALAKRDFLRAAVFQ